MPRLLIVADARWLLHSILTALAWLLFGLLVVYLAAGLWWAIAAGVFVLLVVVLIWWGVLR